jgi:hypothetical protein
MSFEIICADVLEWAAGYEGEKFHALLTDSPYSLHFMGKSWDKDIAFQSETWEALTEHLHPGAFGMSFASARGWHRLAVAIEDAGLIIHPSIFMLGWIQSQGFPKASRVKVNGKEPKEWSGHRYGLQAMKPSLEPIIVFQKPYAGKPVESIVSTGAGALWIDGGRVATGENLNGGAYSGNTPKLIKQIYGEYNKLRPEDYQQPQGRWPPNVCLTHAEGCVRVGTQRVRGSKSGGQKPVLTSKGYKGGGMGQRHNVDHGYLDEEIKRYADPDGLETVDEWQCVDGWQIVEPPAECLDCHQPDPASGWPEQEQVGQIVDYGGIEFKCQHCGERQEWEFARALCPVKALGEQSGESKSSDRTRHNTAEAHNQTQSMGKSIADWITKGHNDTGTAARFFPQFSWQHEIAERSFDYAQDRLAGVTPFYYCAKSARRERDAGLEGIAPENGLPSVGRRKCKKCGAWEWRSAQPDLRRCECEIPEWEKITNKNSNRNPHPTVKPIALAKWLARLLTPPPEYAPRRLLVPFSGSGSEICAAILSQGFEEIVGIEMEEEYVKISESRCRFWETTMKETGSSDPRAILKTYGKKGKVKQDSPEHSPDESSAQMSLGV